VRNFCIENPFAVLLQNTSLHRCGQQSGIFDEILDTFID